MTQEDMDDIQKMIYAVNLEYTDLYHTLVQVFDALKESNKKFGDTTKLLDAANAEVVRLEGDLILAKYHEREEWNTSRRVQIEIKAAEERINTNEEAVRKFHSEAIEYKRLVEMDAPIGYLTVSALNLDLTLLAVAEAAKEVNNV